MINPLLKLTKALQKLNLQKVRFNGKDDVNIADYNVLVDKINEISTEVNTLSIPAGGTKIAILSIEETEGIQLIIHESNFTNTWSISEYAPGLYLLQNTGAFVDVSKIHIAGQVIADGSSNNIASIVIMNSARTLIIGHINIQRGDANNLEIVCFNNSGNQTSLYNLIGIDKLCLPEIRVYS